MCTDIFDSGTHNLLFMFCTHLNIYAFRRSSLIPDILKVHSTVSLYIQEYLIYRIIISNSYKIIYLCILSFTITITKSIYLYISVFISIYLSVSISIYLSIYQFLTPAGQDPPVRPRVGIFGFQFPVEVQHILRGGGGAVEPVGAEPPVATPPTRKSPIITGITVDCPALRQGGENGDDVDNVYRSGGSNPLTHPHTAPRS